MTKPTTQRLERGAHLRWIPISNIKVSEDSQRHLNTRWVAKLAAEFDPEQVGAPTLSHRDGVYYVMDGQHRIQAMREIGWGDQQIQCWVYEELDEPGEAESFLRLNDTLGIKPFDRFRVAVNAGRPIESDVNRIVMSAGLSINNNGVAGGIGAVQTLVRIYRRDGAKGLARTLRIVRDSYGDDGLVGPVLDGTAMMCSRYKTDLVDDVAVRKLRGTPIGQMLGKADTLHKSTRSPKAFCVAATMVEIVNRGAAGKARLSNWWKS
jgi:hypothetical protein